MIPVNHEPLIQAANDTNADIFPCEKLHCRHRLGNMTNDNVFAIPLQRASFLKR